MPSRAVELVAPGGRVVLVGLAGEPSLLDTRTLTLKDATAVGVLSASGGLYSELARMQFRDATERSFLGAAE